MTPSEVANEWAKDFEQKGAMEHAGFWRAISFALSGRTTVWGNQDIFLQALQYAEGNRIMSPREDIRRESAILIQALKKMLGR